MTEEKRKILCYEVEDDGVTSVVKAVELDGKVFAQVVASTTEEARSKLAGMIPPDARAVWVNSPDAHPELRAALATQRSLEDATTTHEPGELPEQLSLGELRARRAELHLCPACSHAPVCVVSRAVFDVDALLVTVSSCQGFEPPPPPALRQLVEQLGSLPPTLDDASGSAPSE